MACALNLQARVVKGEVPPRKQSRVWEECTLFAWGSPQGLHAAPVVHARPDHRISGPRRSPLRPCLCLLCACSSHTAVLAGPDPPAVKCDTTLAYSGRDGTFTYSITIGTAGPKFNFSYETYNVPDQCAARGRAPWFSVCPTPPSAPTASFSSPPHHHPLPPWSANNFFLGSTWSALEPPLPMDLTHLQHQPTFHCPIGLQLLSTPLPHRGCPGSCPPRRAHSSHSPPMLPSLITAPFSRRPLPSIQPGGHRLPWHCPLRQDCWRQLLLLAGVH